MNFEKVWLEKFEEIVELNYQIFKGMYEEEPYSLEKYKRRLENKETIIFIAKENNDIVADSISFEDDDSFYIWIFGVSEKYRRKGIVSALLEKNEQFAKENNYESVSVKVYNVSKEMQYLLRRRGYEVIKVEEKNLIFELKF